MKYEYATVLIQGWPDQLLNKSAAEGWELVTVTSGGFDRQGWHRPVANVLWLRRLRAIPDDDGESE